MTENHKESPEKSISEQLADLVTRLTLDQIRFIVARQEYSSDKEAAETIGLKPDTVYRWPEEVKEAARLMASDGLVVATQVRRRNLVKAMLVKVGGLDSDEEVIRQRASTEIIEWEMGKATQPMEHSGPGGQPIEFIEITSTAATDEGSDA